jgi:hypothetical protein
LAREPPEILEALVIPATAGMVLAVEMVVLLKNEVGITAITMVLACIFAIFAITTPLMVV